MFLEVKERYDLLVQSRGVSYIGDLAPASYSDVCNSSQRWKDFFVIISFLTLSTILVHPKLSPKTTEDLAAELPSS